MPLSLIVWSSLNYYHVHQPVATNSMHLQSTYTPYLQHLSNQRHIWNPFKHLQWSFLQKQSTSLGCWTGFYVWLCPIIHYSLQKVWGEASITGVTQGNLRLTLLPNSLDLHQTQKQKIGLTLCLHFHSLKLCKYFQIPYPSPTVAWISSRTKSLTIWKYSFQTTFCSILQVWILSDPP